MTHGVLRRRLFALAVVLALHCLFLLIVLLEPITLRVLDEPSSVLFFIEAPKPAATPTPPVQSRPTPAAAPTNIQEPKASEAPTSIAPTSPNPSATIDWSAQATQAAAAVVDKAIREETRKCDPSDSPNSFLPPCHHQSKRFEWNPKEPRVGFSGGLPFVRVGERCAIGLGFFGCGFGAKPPANGDLFEGMDDPERERSSVPSSSP